MDKNQDLILTTTITTIILDTTIQMKNQIIQDLLVVMNLYLKLEILQIMLECVI